jgi:hypothetical protein
MEFVVPARLALADGDGGGSADATEAALSLSSPKKGRPLPAAPAGPTTVDLAEARPAPRVVRLLSPC